MSIANPLPWATGESTGRHRISLATSASDLSSYAAALIADGFRLTLVAAHDDGPALRAVYLFTAPAPDRRVELHVPIDRDDPKVPTLASRSFVASRFEREMRDLFGIVPVDHPLPRRLIRHPHWPVGWYPMRHDAGPPPPFGQVDEAFPFLTVEGPGVYEIPVGPVHAGLIEPGHFRFSVVGETILKLKARLWYVHRGVERLFTERDLLDAVPLAERISGDTAVGHSLAFCCAVEDALGIDVPLEARRIRAILLELERVYNHITDIGALCNDVGHSILNTHAQRIRESLLRLNAETTGHRLLRGGVQVGGATIRQVPDPARMAAIAADIHEVVTLALSNSLVAERFTATAVLSAAQAREMGTVGYVARASGVDIDARRDHPQGVLDDYDLDLELLGNANGTPPRTGDVLARFQQRAYEIESSIVILTTLARTVSPHRRVGGWPTGEPPAIGPGGLIGPDHRGAVASADHRGAVASGVGIVEGWRGTITHRVEIGPDLRPTRVKVVDPSFYNWPALPVALANTIVPDFPLANKSFNLSYAGNDL